MADCAICQDASAVKSAGTILEVKDPTTNAWKVICGITDFSGPTSSRGEIDTTTLCSTAKEYDLDIPDYGTLTLNGQSIPGSESHRLLDDLFRTAEKTDFRITLVDDGMGNGAVVMAFAARVSAKPLTAAQGDVLKVSVTLRLSGDITTTLPTGGKRLTFTSLSLSESEANSGAVSGVVSCVLTGDTFAGDAGDPISSPAVTFTGVPSGLTANCLKINDTTAIISFSGSAATHTAGTSAAVGFAFGNTAFTTGPASDISGATGLQITINFI